MNEVEETGYLSICTGTHGSMRSFGVRGCLPQVNSELHNRTTWGKEKEPKVHGLRAGAGAGTGDRGGLALDIVAGSHDGPAI